VSSITLTAAAYDDTQNKDGHYADGRVIYMGFTSFDLLATYSPNNGTNESSFERRRRWDAEVKMFLTRAAERERPVIWVGDLNVARTPADVTHPAFYSVQCPQPVPDDSGQPGYTPNERRRFSEILEAGQLVDTFRHFNPLPEEAFNEELYVHKDYCLLQHKQAILAASASAAVIDSSSSSSAGASTCSIGATTFDSSANVETYRDTIENIARENVLIAPSTSSAFSADKLPTFSSSGGVRVRSATRTTFPSEEIGIPAAVCNGLAEEVVVIATSESDDCLVSSNVTAASATASATAVGCANGTPGSIGLGGAGASDQFILGPHFTWRGSAGANVPESGRYYRKGMRIDYALVSRSILPMVQSVRIHGRGKDLEGFLGSDHCPVILTLTSS
jgi:exonuclease III